MNTFFTLLFAIFLSLVSASEQNLRVTAASEQNLRGLASGDANIDGDPNEKDKSYTVILIVCLAIAACSAMFGVVWVRCYKK
ncbi:hypothetical protein TrCOL_g1846 [Triparma columacea]|uniref:Uncharacterized protein n=1 Tax=Triparma columacea TaxID=722753 RepID=A0A9W7G3F1_9STRA|nr:hypothetical protein TrCOL_g1846 [Triparma columacea]